MAGTMKLKGFRVTNFRSVNDSGWIETDDVGTLIGINESGKSNLLLPLWKLKPAKGGEINPLSDYPRSSYNSIRVMEVKPVFIQAQFELSESLIAELVTMTGATAADVKVANVTRNLDGGYTVGFPNAAPLRALPKADVLVALRGALSEIEKLETVTKGEEALKPTMVAALNQAIVTVETLKLTAGKADIAKVTAQLSAVDVTGAGQRSTIGPRFGRAVDSLAEMTLQISKPHPSDKQEARDLVLAHVPSFVYYSNYGNLDSEIYLPHVIANMARTDLGSKEEAKARTLKVLFDFVNIEPQEILDLGREAATTATKEQLEEISNQKRKRDILLQSASTELTRAFKEWWKQGDYRFRFAADGNHFRIWVSDDKRPEDIELEGRSTGLQWFLSFFLVFLVEAKDAHDGSILLLDEPGLTLHPLAQKDLSAFFDNLSQSNQLLFSTHSPFLVDPDKLDRVRAVYTDENGQTVVSSDLRASAPKSLQEKSIYAAHAALGLSVSDGLLQGCQPVIVEGLSDQYYLGTIKNYLIGKGIINPFREILFMPAGGVKGIKAVVAIVCAKDEELPFVLLDSDEAGKLMAKHLRSDLYATQKSRVVLVGELLARDGTEVEDLLPKRLIAETFSRDYRGRDEDFADIFDEEGLLIPQMEGFAEKHSIELLDGWKVELAKAVKRRVYINSSALERASDLHGVWTKLFQTVIGPVSEKAATVSATAKKTAATDSPSGPNLRQ